MRNATRWIYPALLLSAGLLACQTSGGASGGKSTSKGGTSAPPARAKQMAASTYLPAKAREKIRESMKAHGDDMTVLMWSIIFLDVDGSAEFARVIKDQPWLERPADPTSVPEDERVPEAIYKYQEEIKSRADTLAAMADGSNKLNAAGLADAFGAVARTCVACHAAYLYENGAAAAATAPVDTTNSAP